MYKFLFISIVSIIACFSPTHACFFVCEILPQPIYMGVHETQTDVSLPYTYAVPNPSKGIFDIHYLSNEIGTIRIRLYDIVGNEIGTFESNKSSNKIVVPIKVKSLPEGSYRYSVEVNNIFVISGKIVIMK